MTVGNPVRLIIQFMIPMFLGNVFQQFYNIVDSIVAELLTVVVCTSISPQTDRIYFRRFQHICTSAACLAEVIISSSDITPAVSLNAS